MFKKTAKSKEIKKFDATDVQKMTEKQLKQTMGGYQYPNLCFDYESGKYYKC